MDWKKFEGDKLLFLEAAFVAINQADMESARWLIDAAETMDKENILCWIARGYLALHALDTAEAEKWFNKALELDASSELARTFLGLTHIVGKKKLAEGEKICSKIVEESKNADMKKLATSALDFAEQELKGRPGAKGTSPFDLASDKANKNRKRK